MRAPGFWMPRIAMHMCSHSITTMTPRGLSSSISSVGDLRGEPLLHLRAPGVHLDQPGQLRQPGDAAVGAGDVADVRDTVERQQVVLADRHDLDVADEHQLLVVRLEGRGEHLGRVDPQAGEELGVGAGDPGRVSCADRRGRGPRRPR